MRNIIFKLGYHIAISMVALELGFALWALFRGEIGMAFLDLGGAVCWIGARHFGRLNLIREGLLEDEKEGGSR